MKCLTEQKDINAYWQHWKSFHNKLKRPEEIVYWRTTGKIPEPHQPPAEANPDQAIQIEDPEDNQAANHPEDNQDEEDQPQLLAAIQNNVNDPEDPAEEEEEAVPDVGKNPIGFTPLQRFIWQIIVDQIDEELQEMENNRRFCSGNEYQLSNLDKDLAELESIRNTFSITPVRDPQILDDNGIPVGLSPMQSLIWQFLVDLIEMERQKMEYTRLHCTSRFLLPSLNEHLDELETIRNSFRIN